MNKRTKYILAAVVAVALVSNILSTSKARAAKVSPNQLGADFYASIPAEVIKLRADFEKEANMYEEMMKPYNAKLNDLADEKLSADEAEELLAEVDLKTGEQETKVKDLRADLVARMKELQKAYTAKKRNVRG